MYRRMTGDRGLTLVELLITVVITGLIGTATAGSFLIFMTSTRDSGDEQAIARDQFWLASWWLADAQSAEAWDTGAVGVTCLDVPGDDANTSQPVVQLRWGDAEAEPSTPEHEANYRAERTSTEEPWQLVRYYCESGDPASRAVVVRSLSLSPAPEISPLWDRITIRVTSAIDDTSTLEATGGPHVTP